MPYDRKTELLWNYLSMAQLTDLSRFWNQGPATSTRVELSDWGKTPTITIQAAEAPNIQGSNTTGYHPPELESARLNDSPLLSSPVSEETGSAPSHISVAPYIPPSTSANHSGSVSDYGGAGHIRGDSGPVALHVVSVTNVTTTTTVTAPATATVLANTDTALIEDAEPKIYGPSDVLIAGDIESSPNSQTNDVVDTLDTSEPNVWSDLGSDHIGSILTQMQDFNHFHGHGLVIDYVHGDMTSLTQIQQLNTIFDNDTNDVRSAATAPSGSTLGDVSLAQSVATGDNALGNTTILQGNADLAHYDALVVTGDLTKINRIVQVNLIDDTDHNTVNAHADISTPYGTATSVWDAAIESGGNVEVNIGFIIDNATGAVYLVGGTYGTFTSATQINILSNSDLNDILNLFHSQEGTGFLGFATDDVIRSGGDSQSNMAGFIDGDDTGGNSHPLTQSDLTSLLAFANLHPTQDDGNIHVLFVDGNYTIVNLVVQINVIHDADDNTLTADATGATGALTGPPVVEPTDVDGTASDGTTDNGTTDPDHGADASGTDADHHNADAAGADVSTPSTVDASGTGEAAGNSDAAPATDTGNATETGTAENSDTGTEVPTTDNATPTDTANDNETDSADNTLPVYNDHSSLNYDQVAASGSNDAGNHATILDGGSDGPQLIIVQGHYYEYNEIYQVNILMDSDHNTITSAMNAPTPTGGDHADGVQDSTHLVTADDVLKSMTG